MYPPTEKKKNTSEAEVLSSLASIMEYVSVLMTVTPCPSAKWFSHPHLIVRTDPIELFEEGTVTQPQETSSSSPDSLLSMMFTPLSLFPQATFSSTAENARGKSILTVLHDLALPGLSLSGILLPDRAHESRLMAASAVSQISSAIGDAKATKLAPLTHLQSVDEIQGKALLEGPMSCSISPPTGGGDSMETRFPFLSYLSIWIGTQDVPGEDPD